LIMSGEPARRERPEPREPERVEVGEAMAGSDPEVPVDGLSGGGVEAHPAGLVALAVGDVGEALGEVEVARRRLTVSASRGRLRPAP
jgi:hypothetical protein